MRGNTIQPADAVQNRSSDPVLGVSLQLDVIPRLIGIHGVNQTDDAGRNEIFQAYRIAQLVMDSNGNPAHVRQVFEDEAFSLFAIGRRRGSVEAIADNYVGSHHAAELALTRSRLNRQSNNRSELAGSKSSGML